MPNVFGFGRGYVAPAVASELDDLARKHSTCFETQNPPGDGLTYFFVIDEAVSPDFVRDIERTVLREAETAGLWFDGRPKKAVTR